MKKLVIAAAQSSSIKGDIEANILSHIKMINIAVQNNVDLIIFPELSLIGYEPTVAKALSMNIDDQRLSPFEKITEKHKITIVVGAAIFNGDKKPYLGSFIFNNYSYKSYVKNHLYFGEEEYFSLSKEGSCVVDVNNINVGIAICADIEHPTHVEKTVSNGASIYVAGVLMMDGYDEAAKQMKQYSQSYSIVTVMANHGAKTGGYTPAGKSAIWDENGELIAQAREVGNSLVIGINENNKWRGKVINNL